QKPAYSGGLRSDYCFRTDAAAITDTGVWLDNESAAGKDAFD
ncbi:unnamed protein product, partial [marine sediment metagenome]